MILRPRSIALGLVLLAACGGGGGGNASSGPGAPGGATWHAAAAGGSLRVFGPYDPPALAVDSSGAALLARLDGSGIPRAERLSTDWTELGPAPAGPTGSGPVSITRSAAGEPLVFWTETDPDLLDELHAAAFGGASWSGTAGLVNGAAGESAYALATATGPKGPVAAWTTMGPSAGVNDGRVARLEGGAWRALGAPRPVKALTDGFALALTPGGDPLVAYVAGDGACAAERWDDVGGTWQALPASGVTCSGGGVYVAVDGAGAVFLAGLDDPTTTRQFVLSGLFRLAPGASTWTSVGGPGGLDWTSSAIALAGLPSGGVVLAWIRGSRVVARWTSAGWQGVLPSTGTGYAGWSSPMLGVAGDDDLYLGAMNTWSIPEVTVLRLRRY